MEFTPLLNLQMMKNNFCLKHKRLQQKMELFAGKSQNEIYNFQKNDFFEGRPTFPFSQRVNSKSKFEFGFMFDKEKFSLKKRKRFEKVMI